MFIKFWTAIHTHLW
ncbi:hypothetical protein ID866_12857 [Astraeus odoratus]|nr:hypothetical protein ID866_12857 [Astraeus odoratus]